MNSSGLQEPKPTAFRVWDKDGVRILSVTGPLTLNSLFAFQDAWRAESKSDALVFDLCDVPYADSSAVGSIVNAHVSRQNARQRMAVAVCDRVRKVLQITKVEGLFPVTDTLDEAIAATKKV